MGVSKNSGIQQPWVFLLKMIILGCFGATTIYGNSHILGKFLEELPVGSLLFAARFVGR